MTCRAVRRRLSEWLDGDLEAAQARALSAHLERARPWRDALPTVRR